MLTHPSVDESERTNLHLANLQAVLAHRATAVGHHRPEGSRTIHAAHSLSRRRSLAHFASAGSPEPMKVGGRMTAELERRGRLWRPFDGHTDAGGLFGYQTSQLLLDSLLSHGT
jgi:hypothetical protein